MDLDFECMMVRWHTEVTDTDSVVLLVVVVVVVVLVVGGNRKPTHTNEEEENTFSEWQGYKK